MKRNFLQMSDLTLAEARALLDRAGEMKVERSRDRTAHLGMFRGKSAAIVMEKASTRTRVFRTSTRERLEQMAASARVPVINALSDDGHPVQVLCDVFTIEEALERPVAGLRVAWIGDGTSNMARSFIEAAMLFEFELRFGGPADYLPEAARGVQCTTDAREAVLGADVVCTDVWTSMGQEAENEKRLKAFAGWTVNNAMLANAKPEAIVLHCLPAHRGEEIADETIEGPRSRVWDQAENRLHVQKALMAFLLGSFG
jgi:ornithine carbamoyltransferase